MKAGWDSGINCHSLGFIQYTTMPACQHPTLSGFPASRLFSGPCTFGDCLYATMQILGRSQPIIACKQVKSKVKFSQAGGSINRLHARLHAYTEPYITYTCKYISGLTSAIEPHLSGHIHRVKFTIARYYVVSHRARYLLLGVSLNCCYLCGE